MAMDKTRTEQVVPCRACSHVKPCWNRCISEGIVAHGGSHAGKGAPQMGWGCGLVHAAASISLERLWLYLEQAYPETLHCMGRSKLEQRQGEGSGVVNGDILDSVGPERDVNGME